MATSTIKRTANVNDVRHVYINTGTLITPLDQDDTYCTFEKVGKNVLVGFRGKKRDHTEDEVFLQIPEGYRSDCDRYYSGTIGSAGVIIFMKANGDVSVWSSNPPHGRLVVQLPYMIH